MTQNSTGTIISTLTQIGLGAKIATDCSFSQLHHHHPFASVFLWSIMSSFVAQPQEKCTACGRTVYVTEKATLEDTKDKRVFHKTCIRCQECNKVLNVGNYTSLDGKFFCKPHYKQLFATKGNYDESFGKEKHSKQWEPVATTTPSMFPFWSLASMVFDVMVLPRGVRCAIRSEFCIADSVLFDSILHSSHQDWNRET